MSKSIIARMCMNFTNTHLSFFCSRHIIIVLVFLSLIFLVIFIDEIHGNALHTLSFWLLKIGRLNINDLACVVEENR